MAGLIMDNFDPNWVWYGSAILGAISAGGFLWLRKSHDKDWKPIPEVAEAEAG
jgi:hypothetical protein